MIVGERIIGKSLSEVHDRLKLLMAAANCRISEQNESHIKFTHGSYASQSAYLLPKSGTIHLDDIGSGTRVQWTIAVAPFVAGWLIFVATAGCWAIFPPILAYKALSVEPREFMENLIAGI